MITSLTVHDFRSVGVEVGFNIFFAVVAFSVEEFEWSPSFYPIAVTTIKTFPRDGEDHSAVELKLGWSDFVKKNKRIDTQASVVS